jgi:hypothetical protein
MKVQEAYDLLLGMSDPYDGSWARVNRIKEMFISDRGYPACLGILRKRGLCKRMDIGRNLWDEFVLLPRREDELSKQGL